MKPTRTVSPPGNLIGEELEARGWSQETLADVMGTSATLVSEVINAKRAITANTAALLARAFGTSTEVWLGLEARYQASRAKPKKGNDAARRSKLYGKAPLRAMVKRGWIKDSKDLEDLEREVLEFLDQKSIDDELVFRHAARKTDAYGPTTPEQYAWLFRARRMASALPVPNRWRRSRLDDLVGELRSLTASAEAVQEVPRVMREYGIRFLVIEPLPKAKMDGASFWLDDDSPVIVMAIRYDRIDNFWHTVMHEMGHVRNEDGLAVDVEILTNKADIPESEKRADEFAVASLIRPDELDDFCLRAGPLYSTIKIIGFASRLRVHPGIVVGQLHHRGPGQRGLNWAYFRQMLVPVRRLITPVAFTDGWGKTVPL